MALRKHLLAIAAAGALTVPMAASAGEIVYKDWETNENGTGNYIITVDDNDAGKFNLEFTVDPWNAEGLGLFIDLGDNDVGGASGVGLSNVDPTGQVALFATDTTSNDCGAGCNLNGVTLPIASPDDQWEMVFRLGAQGSNSIQTFSFQINDFGLTLEDWGLIGVRAQQLCSGDDLLPGDNCGGSDKSYGTPGDGGGEEEIPVPGTLLLLGLGLLGFRLRRRA